VVGNKKITLGLSKLHVTSCQIYVMRAVALLHKIGKITFVRFGIPSYQTRIR